MKNIRSDHNICLADYMKNLRAVRATQVNRGQKLHELGLLL